MTTPEAPEVRRSPDGRLIAYCRSAKHGMWRKSDGYDCDTEDVADWTPLVPAESVSPVDTGLRALVDEIRDCLGLPDDADLGEIESTAKTVIRTADDLTSEYDRVRVERDAARAAIADIDAHATPIGLLDPDDPDGSPLYYAVTTGSLHRALGKAYTAEKYDSERERLRSEVERLRVELASHSTPALPDRAAEKLRAFAAGLLAEEPESEPDRGDWLQGHDAGLTEASVRAGNDLMALLAELGLSSPATDLPVPQHVWPAVRAVAGRAREAGQNEYWTWHAVYTALRALGYTVDDGTRPATDPEPATPDPTAPYREILGCLWLYVNWHYVTKQLTTEQKELWADAVDGWLEPTETPRAERWWREHVAPQAPAEPTGIVIADGGSLTITDPSGIVHLAGPAVPEDTATPTWTAHEVTTKTDRGYTSAWCSTCGLVAGDFDAQWVQDRIDSHRADTTRPAGEE